MSKSTPWIRSYREALHNPKILSLSDRLFRMWQCCLWAADNNGVLPAKTRDLAYQLRVTPTEAEQIICDLIEAELVDVSSPGTSQRKLSMHDWHLHQYVDLSTERVRKFRNKNKDVKKETAKRNETRFTPLRKLPESYSESESESNDLSSSHAPKKDDKVVSGILKRTGRQDKLVSRAEGLGIPVDELTETVARHKAKNRSAYFTKLCVEWLQARLPGLEDQAIRDALWGKNQDAYSAIVRAMMEVV